MINEICEIEGPLHLGDSQRVHEVVDRSVGVEPLYTPNTAKGRIVVAVGLFS